MILSSVPQSNKASLMMIEGGLTLLTAIVAFGWPGLGAGFFSRLEKPLARLARKQGLSVVVVGLAALLLRLAILPVCPIPHPFVPDDFSFLLAADTFASGRLANPTPAMWVHFETMHVSMQPTYASMYFPAQGLVLAAAKLLTGNPWYGVLLMSVLMCAAICWMLQAWLPPTWALLGGMVSVLHIGLFSYWINTYTGAGSIAALGGALLLGALPRFLKAPRLRYTLLMAVGVVLVAATRPFEGLFLFLPVAAMLGHWLFFGKHRPSPRMLFRLSAAPLALLVATAAWMGYYNYRAFGSPLTLPYTLNRNTYAIAPYFVWQAPRPEPAYRHEMMRRFYHEHELVDYERLHARVLYQSVHQGIRGDLVLRRLRFAATSTDVSPRASGPPYPLPGDMSGGLDGRSVDSDISHPALPGSVHGGSLRARVTGHAAPAAGACRRPAGRAGLGTDDGGALRFAGWIATGCRPPPSGYLQMAGFEMEFQLVRPRLFWQRTSSGRARPGKTSRATAGHRPLLG